MFFEKNMKEVFNLNFGSSFKDFFCFKVLLVFIKGAEDQFPTLKLAQRIQIPMIGGQKIENIQMFVLKVGLAAIKPNLKSKYMIQRAQMTDLF